MARAPPFFSQNAPKTPNIGLCVDGGRVEEALWRKVQRRALHRPMTSWASSTSLLWAFTLPVPSACQMLRSHSCTKLEAPPSKQYDCHFHVIFYTQNGQFFRIP